MTTILRALILAGLFLLPVEVLANKVLMPGEVIKGHAKEEENCEKCHKRFDKTAQSQLCMDCHKDVGKDVKDKLGFHGHQDAAKECKECHAEHKGREFKAAEFDKDKFDHKLTGFELKGGHKEGVKEERKGAKVKCDDCHKAGKKFRDAPALCVGCHKKDDKHKGGLGDNCAKCHVDKGWKVVEFDHNKTHFKLLGKHIEVKCEKCHIEGKFKDTPKTCVACHKKDDDKAHKGRLGKECEKCHNEKDWKTARFDHRKTHFKLLGKHDEVKCVKCHINNKYKDTPKTCVACHKKDDIKAHQGKLGTDCAKCHNAQDWKSIKFDHSKTKFKLLGKHIDVKCIKCHIENKFKDTPKQCSACHKKDDDKAHQGKLGADCAKCHSEVDWKKITFNHTKQTKYPLLGRHFLVECKKCHVAELLKDIKTDCWSCHEKDDVHKRKFGTECQTCHNSRSWKAWDFDHNRTNFKLVGAHKKTAKKCYACHQKPMTNKVLQTKVCGSCHDREDVHNGNFGDRCERCHEGNDWKQIKKGLTTKRK